MRDLQAGVLFTSGARTVAVVQKKWENLRDYWRQLKREQKKREPRSGAGAADVVTPPNWKYWNSMKFLMAAEKDIASTTVSSITDEEMTSPDNVSETDFSTVNSPATSAVIASDNGDAVAPAVEPAIIPAVATHVTPAVATAVVSETPTSPEAKSPLLMKRGKRRRGSNDAISEALASASMALTSMTSNLTARKAAPIGQLVPPPSHIDIYFQSLAAQFKMLPVATHAPVMLRLQEILTKAQIDVTDIIYTQLDATDLTYSQL